MIAGSIALVPSGNRVERALLVIGVESRSYGDGKDCIVLTLCDAGGRIDSAPFWPARQSLLAGIARGAVVRVAGEIQTFRGRRQLEVACIAPAPDADPTAFLPSVGDTTPLWARLDLWRSEIRAPRLASVLALFYDDADFRQRYGQCPASTMGHHAKLGGLLRHTCEVAAIARTIAEGCGADAELVLAGALLHDIGKVEAYRWSTGFETTDAGALLGHVALGLMMVQGRVAGAEPPPCNEPELLFLLHLIGSHHGRLEFGATTLPMTLEAEVLHHADDASAKATAMADALADPDNFAAEGRLSLRGVWQLDRRRAYRGNSDWGRTGAKKERPTSRG